MSEKDFLEATPKSNSQLLDEALKEIAVQKERLSSAGDRNTKLQELLLATEKLSEANAKAEKETRAQFADLKQRLVHAENELQRLNGYMARVHEDDIVRDGLVEIEDSRGKRMVPKRPRPQEYQSAPIGYDMSQQFGGNYEERRQTHWTSY